MRIVTLAIALLICTNAQAQIIRAEPFYVAPEEAVSANLLLDDYPCSGGAYSFRKLRTAYTGNCITVRRWSDNSESDIGFSDNYLDTSALKTFIGSDTATVVRWYDQSTGGRNASQTTALRQPFIAFGGALNYHDGEIAIKNIGGNQYHLVISSITHSSIYTVAKNDELNLVSYVTWGTSGILYGGTFSGINGVGYVDGNNFYGSNVEDTNEHLAHVHVNSSNDGFFLDGQRITTSSLLNNQTTTNIAGRASNDIFPIIGQIKEIIIYTDDQLANDGGIANNINSFYSIY